MVCDHLSSAPSYLVNCKGGLPLRLQSCIYTHKLSGGGPSAQRSLPLLQQSTTKLALHAGAKKIEDESRLVLYALHQQATVGPCTEPKPWAWSVVESAKWQSWVQLGDMSAVEAMRLYVKLLDEEIQVRPASCLLSCQQTFALCLPLSRWVCHLI